MDKELKLALGNILGNIYLVQKEQGKCDQSDSHIFGLLNGFEMSLNSEFENQYFVSSKNVSLVADELEPYDNGQEIESHTCTTLRLRLEHREGISEAMFTDICKFLAGRGSYTQVIEQLGITALNL